MERSPEAAAGLSAPMPQGYQGARSMCIIIVSYFYCLYYPGPPVVGRIRVNVIAGAFYYLRAPFPVYHVSGLCGRVVGKEIGCPSGGGGGQGWVVGVGGGYRFQLPFGHKIIIPNGVGTPYNGKHAAVCLERAERSPN